MTEAEIIELRTIAMATLKELLGSTAHKYKLDSGDGSQQMEYKKIAELKDIIADYDNQLAKVRSGGLVYFGTKRYV